MNKTVIVSAITLVIGVSLGAGWPLIESTIIGHPMTLVSEAEAEAGKEDAKKPLFYRNPMNPAITSPVAAKDEMGMDYIPVFADKGADKPPAAKKPLFYRNPMNPAITSPVFAKDEMGMDYIAVYADEDSGGSDEPAGTVKIDPVMVQNIGVKTVLVEQRNLVKSVRATGRISIDESRMARIHPRSEGWVEKQLASRIGDRVSKGDQLLQVYSPQLVTSQQEYLLALNNLKALQGSRYPDIRDGAQELVDSSRQRLQFLEMPEHEIRILEQTSKVSRSVSIESPFDGVVLNIGAREGQFIMPKTELYMLADLSKVWLIADVYEYELPWISLGDSAEMEITGMGERAFIGKVSYIYPYAEARTRTVKVRIEFDNPDGLLKPDMFVNVTIGADARNQALVVPSEAIVRSGSREQVFVVRAPGKFEPRLVELGYSSDGWVEVRSGLKVGERVVNSALFLIDSESKLREATAKMMEALQTPEPEDSAMSMDGLSMSDLSMDDLSMDKLSMDNPSDGAAADEGMSMEGMSMDSLNMDNSPAGVRAND